MSYSPAPKPPWPGESDSPSISKSSHAPTELASDSAEPESVLEALREQVASGEQDTEVLLDAITEAAQFITGASGSALGMRRDGFVTCVRRSGETAPEVGVRLSEESGISGECLRAGRTLRCADTETDPRVDAEVCRALGIRSIATVPVRSNNATVGLLEVFSTEPRAFSDEHIALLSSLAGLVETACAHFDFRLLSETVPAFTQSQASEVDSPITSAFWSDAPWWHQPKWRYAAAAGVVLIAFLSLASWRVLRKPAPDSNAQIANVKPAAHANDAIPSTTIAEQLHKPDPGRITADNTNPTKPPLVQAAKREIEEPLVRRFETVPTAKESKPQLPEGVPASEPPQIQVRNDATEAISGFVSSSTAMPTLGVPVSQGVTPLVLERRVPPIYPAQALLQRLEGAVVLQAFVDVNGRVDQVTLLSGSQLLGRAAIDAVKQWRYRPSLLNGKPVRAETRITINFQAAGSR